MLEQYSIVSYLFKKIITQNSKSARLSQLVMELTYYYSAILLLLKFVYTRQVNPLFSLAPQIRSQIYDAEHWRNTFLTVFFTHRSRRIVFVVIILILMQVIVCDIVSQRTTQRTDIITIHHYYETGSCMYKGFWGCQRGRTFAQYIIKMPIQPALP